jgi:hypothetical protein
MTNFFSRTFWISREYGWFVQKPQETWANKTSTTGDESFHGGNLPLEVECVQY